MISLTHAEAMTVVKIKTAIAAMNDLVIHLNRHPDAVPPGTKERIIEADFMLNAGEDDVINDDPEMRITT